MTDINRFNTFYFNNTNQPTHEELYEIFITNKSHFLIALQLIANYATSSTSISKRFDVWFIQKVDSNEIDYPHEEYTLQEIYSIEAYGRIEAHVSIIYSTSSYGDSYVHSVGYVESVTKPVWTPIQL